MHSTTALVTVLLSLAVCRSAGAASVAAGVEQERQLVQQQEQEASLGQLLLAQVVFRHGARTPLENIYWPDTQWTPTSCPSTFPSSINLTLYDPNDRKVTPVITDITSPELPGGCRMGRLTTNGYNMAVKLGQTLRQQYIDRYKLLPGRFDPKSISAHSTAIQRTIDTLQGVLSGLYPGVAAAVPVAVRNETQEIAFGSGTTCPRLPSIFSEIQQKRKQMEAEDPDLQDLIKHIKHDLRLPPDAPFHWSPLRDTIVCMTADEKPLPVPAAVEKQYVPIIDQTATQEMFQFRAPGPDSCLISKGRCRDVVQLSIGLLLHEVLRTMKSAVVGFGGDVSDVASSRSSSSSSSSSVDVTSNIDDDAQDGNPQHSARKLLISDTPQQQQHLEVNMLRSRPQPIDVSVVHTTTAGVRLDAVRQSHIRTKFGIESSSPGIPSSNSDSSSPTQPKLVLYSAHDTTLMLLLTALGQRHQHWPGFTSHIAFELWKLPGSSSADHYRVTHPVVLRYAFGSASSDRNDFDRSSRYAVRVLLDGEALVLQQADSTRVNGERALGLRDFEQLIHEYVIGRKEHDAACTRRDALHVLSH